MSNWRKREHKSNKIEDLESLMEEITGMTREELADPKQTPAMGIENMEEAVSTVIRCVFDERRHVVIVGDYDADGITSSAILSILFSLYNVKPKVIIPKRFTDGYGISETLIKDVRDSLIICVDNGIAAIEPIKSAKENGNMVVVLDHHLMQEGLPPADVIVDPHIHPENNTYEHYCGAGLSYKFAWQMCYRRYPELDRDAISALFLSMMVLAMVGTLADVMPLTGDNRFIVKTGLRILNNNNTFLQLLPGIRTIMDLVDAPFDEESITYTIAPIINAAGRMYNAGSTSALKAILCTDLQEARRLSWKMREINEERKNAVAEWMKRTESNLNLSDSAFVIYIPKMPEGIVGIVAGKIAEKYARPTFVLTDIAAKPGQLRGSGRTYANFDLAQLVGFLKAYCERAGGHVGAAGITVLRENLIAVQKATEWYMKTFPLDPTDQDVLYDVELTEQDVAKAMDVVKRFAPYGEGCRQPVFLLKDFQTVMEYNDFYKTMGKEREHIKLFGEHVSVVGFGLAEKYVKLGFPRKVDAIGTVSENCFNGNVQLQFQALDLRACE